MYSLILLYVFQTLQIEIYVLPMFVVFVVVSHSVIGLLTVSTQFYDRQLQVRATSLLTTCSAWRTCIIFLSFCLCAYEQAQVTHALTNGAFVCQLWAHNVSVLSPRTHRTFLTTTVLCRWRHHKLCWQWTTHSMNQHPRIVRQSRDGECTLSAACVMYVRNRSAMRTPWEHRLATTSCAGIVRRDRVHSYLFSQFAMMLRQT